MGKETGISWCDATLNFWHGCLKVSTGCKFCYMYRDKARYGNDAKKIIRSAKATFNAALKWKDPKKIFTCSWSDFFIKEADAWRQDAWDIIKATPHHTWIILTKRPERIKDCLPADWGAGYDNVWLGISAETQKTFDFRILQLLKIKAKVRLISLEPLLSRIDITPYLNIKLDEQTAIKPIHWVIVGGESGNESGSFGYRHMKLEWAHEIVKACTAQDIPVWVKQLGTSAAKMAELTDRHGGDITEANFPEHLKIQQFPRKTGAQLIQIAPVVIENTNS